MYLFCEHPALYIYNRINIFRSQCKSLSDDNLLSPNTISRRHSLLRARARDSVSPSSILTTSSSPRLSSHTYNSPQSKVSRR